MRIRTAVFVSSLIVGLSAHADPVLIISDGVTTSGPITLTGGSGNYTSASFDNSWSVVVGAGSSKPVTGSASNPDISLSIVATSLGSANPLTFILSDNNFGPTSGNNNLFAQLIGQPTSGTGDAVTFNTYYDGGNGLDVLTTELTGSGSVLPNAGNEYVSDITNSLSLTGPYSLTEVVEIAGGQAASYSLSALLVGTNLAPTNVTCNCTIDFSDVPTNLTVGQSFCQLSCQPFCQPFSQLSCQPLCQSSCQSTQIPNPVYEAYLIKATDSCLGSVPVEFLGAVTNQVCPTNGYCFLTNGICYFPNGICCPTNGLCFPANGICFITNGYCCPVRNCSLDFQNCQPSGGNCFQVSGNCFQSSGNCFQGYVGNCYQNNNNCYQQNYNNCNQKFGGCYGSYGNCSQFYGNCSFSNQCSTVITFSFGATNGCGLLQTVTQTITVEPSSQQPCFNITCSQPPQICYPQPPQNCYPQQPQNCYPQQPQNCYPQQPQNCYPQQPQNCYPQQPQNCYTW